MHYASPEVYEFISKQTNDPIVEWKTCAVSGTKFPVFESDAIFYETAAPIFDGQRFSLPKPDICREERQRKRLAWRNLNKLYRRKCDASNKEIISIYHKESPFTVFDQKIWRSDQYDPLQYGKSFDFSETFTENFKVLQHRVPRCSLLNGMNENSDYANHSYYNKDCYLVFASGFNQDCMFTDRVIESNEVLDSWNIEKGNNCYECLACKTITGCIYVSYSENCGSCRYCYDCKNCSHCIGCVGLVNKDYHILNQSVTPEQYKKALEALGTDPLYKKNFEMKYHELLTSLPRSATMSVESDKSCCIESKYAKDSKFIIEGREIDNVAYGSELLQAKNCRDFDVWGVAEKVYEVHCAGGTLKEGGASYMYNVMFSNVVWHGHSVFYSDNCLGEVNNCFGCVGLKNHSYCIFNVQYSKEEYQKEVRKIVEHMVKTGERGEYFDNTLIPFGYNETMAMLHSPLSQEDVETLGYRWKDEGELTAVSDSSTIKPQEYTIEEWQKLRNDNILNQIITCSVSGKPFRIVKQELEFYRKHDLPIPTKHPDVRHQERLAKRPGRKLYLRNCNKTGEEIISVYPEEFEGRVYSEKAYEQEVYS